VREPKRKAQLVLKKSPPKRENNFFLVAIVF